MPPFTPVDIRFYHSSDRIPADNEEVVLIRDYYYGTSIEISRCDYNWDEVDKTGLPTGNSVVYNGEKELEGHKLTCMFGNEVLADFWWAHAAVFDDLLDNEP